MPSFYDRMANRGEPDALLSLTCNKYLNTCLRSSFVRCLNEGRKWRVANDYYKYISSIREDHLHLIDDPMIKKIVLCRRVYNWPNDLNIICVGDIEGYIVTKTTKH